MHVDTAPGACSLGAVKLRCIEGCPTCTDGGAWQQEDSEGNTSSFEIVIAQLFEALLAVADSTRLQHLLKPGLPDLIHTTIGPLLSM